MGKSYYVKKRYNFLNLVKNKINVILNSALVSYDFVKKLLSYFS